MACGRVLGTALPAISNGRVRKIFEQSNNRPIRWLRRVLRLSQSEFGSGTDEHVVHEQMLTRRSACCGMGTSAENAR
jgi:hypothetical protein